jgi:hypothetical protein
VKANPAPMSVADYCHDNNNKKIVVNTEYQRKEGIWTNLARSFFIESILLEYPIPKIYLYARLDLKTRQTVKEIVDGQQRTQALVAFFNNRLRLSKTLETEELREQRYNQLSDDWKTKFLSYSLPIDQFSGVPEDEVREAFRRMNANTVPLNDEEQRNARFQGPFKWFIVSVAEQFKDTLYTAGVFSRRDFIRMADLRLYSEIALTLDSGFQTIKAKPINDLYKKYNGTFEKEEEYKEKIRYGVDFFLEDERLHEGAFLRAHIVQSIALAGIALHCGGAFEEEARLKQRGLAERLDHEPVDLEVLSNAIQDPESYPALYDFTSASAQKTNVEATRIVRFLYFKAALSNRA